MKLKKPCYIGGLSWAKVLSITLLFVLLLYPNGMTGKALIQEESNPRGIETRGDPFRTPGMERGRATPESLRTDRNYISPLASNAENPNRQSARLLAGLASDIAVEGSLLDGPGTGQLYLPLIFKDFDPALYALVPYLQGLTQSEAEAAILAAQLTVGNITQGTSPTVPAGKVKSQNPADRLYVAKGTAVDLVISLGPAIVNVPDVVGRTQAEAKGLIVAAALAVGTVTTAYSDTVPFDKIIGQSPLAGTSVIEGTAVNLVVSLGPPPGLPPDPSTIAPPVDPTVATTMGKSTEFLYTGPTPIQTGVAPGTIDPKRAAVIRGKVLDRGGNALPAVPITILNHPEYGQTLSRSDGMFDLAVNGGGYLTVKYQKNGYLEVQRQLKVPWQDYVWAPDVVLIGLDSQVTAIDLNAGIPFQVARGSVTSDNRGTRQSTLLFAQGTQAELVLPNGTTQPISNLTVRSTEYTVGESGPKAMPGELPPGVGYTYAVELSVDEAMATGASEIRFSQPVVNYIENFLGFPTGWPVPAYYYDRKQGRWVPFPNGRVIKILSISGNMADLDVDGDDVADTGAKLTNLGITDAERQQIASLYSAGQSLWRVSLLHFSPFDYNYGYNYPPDASPPPPDVKPDKTEDDACKSQGSIIECQNQTLGESIGITGTPFTLNYRSDRVPGRVSANTLKIPLTGPTIYYQNIFLSVELEIEVAGRKFSYSYPPQPNLFHSFMWDGLDAYGRKVQGRQPISIRLGYKYMGRRCNGLGDCRYVPYTYDILWSRWDGKIGRWDFSGRDLGSWSLNVQNFYNPAEKTLYLGTGERSAATDVGTVVTQPISYINLETKYGINHSSHYFCQLATAPDGSLYIADASAHGVYRYDPVNDTLTKVAGATGCVPYNCKGYAGDGGPATLARLNQPQGIAFGPDGSYYIADTMNQRIRRVGADGIITTVAGNGVQGYSGDGGPALNAALFNPDKLAVGIDGTIYIENAGHERIRRVSPDGIITTKVSSSTSMPRGLALGPEGSLYYADLVENRVFRLWPDGKTTIAAGNGSRGSGGDGGPAPEAQLDNPIGLAVGLDGNLFISESFNVGYIIPNGSGSCSQGRVRRVGPDGIIITLVGGGPGCDLSPGIYGVFGGPANAATLPGLNNIALGPDGSMYADYPTYIYRIGPPLPGFSLSDILIPSSDARELYVFNSSGRHLRTINALTQSLIYEFNYDSAGRLIQIADGSNNTTAVERNANGTPTAIVGPYGQRTTLALDANGYLNGITNPAGATTSFQYTSDGLMTGMTTPRGHVYSFTYDSLGRLTRDDDPAGGFQSLTKTQLANGYEVTRTTALGRSTTYRVENLPTGDKQMTNTFPDGKQTTALLKTDGTQTITTPDGTVTTVQQGPDPRFGMQSPIPKSMTIQTPGGLTYSLGLTRSVSLSNANDPLSLISQTNSLVINNRAYQSQYTAATKQQTSTSPQGRQTVTTLDVLGRVVKKERTGIEPISLTYDANGKVTKITRGPEGGTRDITLAYNLGGYLSSVTDPLSRTMSLEYDQAGRLTRQVLPGGRTVSYSYDAYGNLKSITPPGWPAHLFSYTPIDKVEEYTPPSAGPGTGQTTYTYNADRQLTSVTRPDGKIVSLAYDAGGRLGSRTILRGTTLYAYAAQTGKLASINSPDGGVLSFTYDGSLITGMAWQGTVAGTFGVTYDNNFLVASQSVNGGNTVNFVYDNDGLLTQVGDLTINRSTVNGLITGSTLGVVTDMRSYNTFGELSNYSAAVNASPIFSVQYTRDKLGRIIEKSETVGVVSKVFSYSYDISSRLAEVKEGGITVAAYTYDSNGNRLSYAGLGGTTTYTYDDQDRLLSLTSGAQSQNFTYTGNGELSGKTAGSQNTVYQYDELGNLLVVSLPDGNQVTYVIDGKNRRIGKKVNNVLIQGWLYQDRLRPAAELDGSGNPVSRFVYGSRRNVPDYLIKDGTVYRIISDHLGSVRLVVDTATGTIMQRMDYDAFGNVTLDTSPGFQPFGYAGGLYDRDTRLTRFGARDYDAETGRWTVKDPIRFAGGDPNLYRYVSNNPVNRSDQSGLSPVVDSYPTSEDAAEAAMNEIYIQSKATDSEMGGYIYQNPDLTYSYTDPVTGETGTCTLNMPKPPDTAIGFYHSHPNMCSAEFSNLDKEFIKKQELLEMYVITPEGETLVYACY